MLDDFHLGINQPTSRDRMSSSARLTTVLCSTRAAAVSSAKKRRWEEEDLEDLTRDMDNPPTEPGIQEVQLTKQGKLCKAKRVMLLAKQCGCCRTNRVSVAG